MYLKSIEVQGFKSFANRIVFEFHNGITAIVGPNGSGKSNVADAVRWVLGEQRIKQLRGASMQDVIFAGTQLRKPQGFAYVAITLNNSDHQLAIDYDEVVISRRLYRSGESEYKINGSACRLKDIYELFYDTGIGKEGYSIIGQGQIDRILSGKPEERRELFDEAAGIVKFKHRKTAAQKKLEDEQQNLLRVKDILSELEKQVGPLARQSEAAKKYLVYREELKKQDINLYLTESETIRRQLDDISQKADIISADMNDASSQAEQQKAEYDRLEQEIRRLEEQLEDRRNQANKAEILVGNLEGQIAVLREQIRTEELKAEHAKERLQSLTRDLEEKEKQIQTYQDDNAGLMEAADTSRREKIAAEYALTQQDADILELEQQLERAKSEIISGLNDKANLSADNQRYETMLEQIQIRKAEITQKLMKYKSEDAAWEETLREEQGKLEKANEVCKNLTASRFDCEQESERLDLEIRRLSRSLNELKQSYQASKTRRESLRNLAERYEGYGNSTKKIMELRGQKSGICGVVADLIATDPRYETAIETALGGSIQNVVTDTETTAKELIAYLKKNKFGRQTFLPLDAIGHNSTFSRPEALKEKGVIGIGSSLVQVEPEFRVLAEYLLGRVIVMDTVDHAIALARKYKHSLRIVTLEGELLNAGGSMTGGAFRNSSNLLGRRRELEELEQLCKKTSSQIDEVQKELTSQEGLLAAAREREKKLGDEIRQESILQNTLRMNVENLQTRREELRASYQDFELENTQLENQSEDIRISRKKIREETAALESRTEQHNQKIETMNSELDQAKKNRETAAAKLEQVNLKAANLRQKADFVMENIRRVREESGKLQEELDCLRNGSQDHGQIVAQKEQEIIQLEELIGNASEERKSLLAQQEKLNEEKEAMAASQKVAFTRREEMSDRAGRLDKDLFRLQSQKEKLEEKLENQVSYIWNEYELTPVTAAELQAKEPIPVGEVKKRIDELKSAIRGLGHVNVNAIEDYQEISQRYEFMKTQVDDLQEAEQALIKIIEELDTGMRNQFKEKFQEIRMEFDRVFRELFGGGHGTLDLMEDVDILEAGIQIIAQPPGKKLQNMMQLSGGEKALTAIALLFAIQNLKPSPFCLLDEIEAALDDSNVDRFAGYLHKLTAHTQFIVITHRRGTMVSADRLYGITMQEKGISTLVSVSLIEDQLS